MRWLWIGGAALFGVAAFSVWLAFRDPGAAVAVLSGKKSAVTALGACDASIRGLVPLVQGLFAVLDRASRYLAVKADKEAGHGR